MDHEIEVIEYITFKKTFYVEADNKKEARSKAKKQDWFDAGPDGVCIDHGVKKVFRNKNN